jgi:hypothetical protein
VELEPTRVEVTPRAGAWIEADRLQGAIKKAGFKPGEIRLTVVGTLTEWQSQPALRLPKGERIVLLQPDPGTPEPMERARQALPTAADAKVTIEGQLVERTKGSAKSAPVGLRVRKVEIGS